VKVVVGNIDVKDGYVGSFPLYVVGYLSFQDCVQMTDVDGLASLQTVHSYLSFNNCAAMTNVDGMSSLQTVHGNLDFYNCRALTTVDGISSLQTIHGYLHFSNCTSLTSVNGLSSLQTIKHDIINVTNCPAFGNFSKDNVTLKELQDSLQKD
jgi:hypothetical protein